MKFKAKAMRAGVWFRSLHRIDRALIDLTINVKNTVRSATLANRLFAIMRRLEGLLMSKLEHAVEEFGLPLAQKLSSIAQGWGHPYSKRWASDLLFMSFLAVMHMNEPKGFRK